MNVPVLYRTCIIHMVVLQCSNESDYSNCAEVIRIAHSQFRNVSINSLPLQENSGLGSTLLALIKLYGKDNCTWAIGRPVIANKNSQLAESNFECGRLRGIIFAWVCPRESATRSAWLPKVQSQTTNKCANC